MALDEELRKGLGNHDEPRAVGQVGVIGAHGVFHAVLSGGGGQLHGDARHRAAVGDMLTGLKIVPVPDRVGQVTGNMADGRQRDGFAEDVYPLRHHDLRVVEQRVKPLIGRIGRRHGSHQLGIDDRQHGDEPRITEPDFFLGFRIGDDSPAVDFRAGTRRGGDGHDRQARIGQRTPLTRAALHIIPQVAVIGCHRGNRGRGVQHCAAAQRHDEIAPVFPGERGALHHGVLDRVFHDPVKHGVSHTGGIQLPEGTVEIPVGPCGFPV